MTKSRRVTPLKQIGKPTTQAGRLLKVPICYSELEEMSLVVSPQIGLIKKVETFLHDATLSQASITQCTTIKTTLAIHRRSFLSLARVHYGYHRVESERAGDWTIYERYTGRE